MAEELLDKLADDTVSGLKGFFTHRINNGEDPTTYLRMFLNLLESNKEKDPQFFKKIAFRIDSSFFAPLKKVNQVASQDDFIATYHNLVNKLIEIHPQMPYKADYERQKALIENDKRLIKEKLRKEKEEKRRIVDDEYRRILSERKKEYKENGSGKGLRIGFVVCFVLFVVFLLVGILVPDPYEDGGIIIMVGGGVGLIVVGLLVGWGHGVAWGFAAGLAVTGFFWGLFFAWGSPFLVFTLLVLGIILAAIYGSKVDTVRLSPEERSAYDTSLDNIEQHFSDKEKHEIAQSTVGILTMDDH